MLIRKSALYDQFRCIAGSCPDSCCKEWDVQIDNISAARYHALPGALGERLRQVMTLGKDGSTIMTIENGRCPMWRSDGLCRIQAELGEAALCKTCRDFPRLTHDYGDFAELGLELACPEAASLILTAPVLPPAESQVPGGEPPQYDTQAMSVLLRTRQKALTLLSNSDFTPNEVLALLLFYGYQAQAELDDAEVVPFDAAASLESAAELAHKTDIADLSVFFADLEILTDGWKKRLNAPALSVQWPDALRNLARYFVERYWLQAVSDYDLVCRVKFTVASCALIASLGGELTSTAQLYSKEIENNIDNVDAILDAAYTHPAFADDRLLGLLLK